ncbi:MAG: amidophosphoribosyltransferase [Patescibacteria group bacterium]|nr:amidophosphoribosyltransferase [Patescibacteria group bacterium]
MFELDGWLHECGVVGIVRGDKSHNILELLYKSLFCLQHRGQESAGVALANGHNVKKHKGWGRVELALDEDVLRGLARFRDVKLGIGHVRYATAGAPDLRNAQPHYVEPSSGRMVLTSNGDIANYRQIRSYLVRHGVEINTRNDGELLLKAIEHFHRVDGISLVEAIKVVSQRIRGTWSAILMTRDKMIIFRDPLGNRPLCIGQLGKTMIFASETCVLDCLNAVYQRDVKPGEIIEIDLKSNQMTYHQVPSIRRAHCIFELIYFARPDSFVFGEEAGHVRHRMGRRSAQRHPVKQADFCTPVPDSGNQFMSGYAKELGVPFALGIIKNPYVGRTFIMPGQRRRKWAVDLKFNIMHDIWGTRMKPILNAIFGDDSIVRATTTQALISKIKCICHLVTGRLPKIHYRVSSPPIRFPCPYGIDTPTFGELVANRFLRRGQVNVAGIAQEIGVDSLGYLTVDDLRDCVSHPDEFCYACFNGEYPIGTKDCWTK